MPENTHERVTVRIPTEILEKAWAILEQEPDLKNVSDLIRRALVEYIAAYEGEKIVQERRDARPLQGGVDPYRVYVKVPLHRPLYWRLRWYAENVRGKRVPEVAEEILFDRLKTITERDAREWARDNRFFYTQTEGSDLEEIEKIEMERYENRRDGMHKKKGGENHDKNRRPEPNIRDPMVGA